MDQDSLLLMEAANLATPTVLNVLEIPITVPNASLAFSSTLTLTDVCLGLTVLMVNSS